MSQIQTLLRSIEELVDKKPVPKLDMAAKLMTLLSVVSDDNAIITDEDMTCVGNSMRQCMILGVTVNLLQTLQSE